MADQWIGTGVWSGWRITTDHASSSYNQPVLVDPNGTAYGPGDILNIMLFKHISKSNDE